MKRQRAIEYFGLGFPVVLRNVPVMMIDGGTVPDVNFNQLENAAAVVVSLKPGPLTGNEIKFLRRHLGLNQQAFARRLQVTRQCVIGWEKTADRPTAMEPATEKMLRLFVLREKNIQPTLFEKAFDRITGEARKRMNWKCEIRVDRPMDGNVVAKEMLSNAA